MSTLMSVLTHFAPADAAGKYDRYKLWAMPHKYIVPNLLAAVFWSSVLAILSPHSMLLRDMLLALTWLNCSLVIACVAIMVLVQLGVGPDFLDGKSPIS